LPFRQRTISSYPRLFSERAEGDKEDFTSRAVFAKKWSWYQSIYAIAKGDLTKFDEVTRLGVHECFTYLSFEGEKNEIEQQEINKISKRR